mmetsp:Transcript_18042/g.16345  ORF Transcript_18042/g.16345 Transcript_18042/m.16345 type:complete len:285 (+) Transcript_18042:77-931(+)
MSNQVSIISSFGRTGSGKSYIGNLLTKPGTFVEGNTLESVTTTISSAVSWNGRDIFADVPGYFDTQGQDQIQQANFIDYLEGKFVKAILFVFTDRIDSFIKIAINTFRNSELKDNLILVVNKDLDANRSADIASFEGFPVIYIKAHQADVEVLKRYIDSKTPVFVKNPPTPMSLFKQPLKIVREEEVSEFHENTEVPEKETLVSTKQVPFRTSREVWDGDLGKIIGKKKTVSYDEIRNVTESNDVIVNRKYAVNNIYKLTYAERFDGKASLYKKEFIQSEKTKI